MLIYLDHYRDMTATAPRAPRYGDEVLNANWMPRLTAVAPDTPVHGHAPDLPDDLNLIDAEEFLARIYALATQV